MQRSTERIFDEYLAASARAGSRPALGRLVERWQPRLLRHAARLLGDADAAGDVVQEAWIEIVRGLPHLDDANAFPAWAFRIVTRRCSRWIRRVQSRRKLAATLAAQPLEAVAAGGADDRLDADRAARAIERLPPEQKAAVALFYLEDLSVAEAAIALNVPVGTVKTRLMHARAKLRAALTPKEGPHERTG